MASVDVFVKFLESKNKSDESLAGGGVVSIQGLLLSSLKGNALFALLLFFFSILKGVTFVVRMAAAVAVGFSFAAV